MVGEILKLIETVDPSDTAKLDEIDSRTFYFVKGSDPDAPCWIGDEQRPSWHRNPDGPNYSRSRDALKTIRPEGVLVDVNAYYNIIETGRRLVDDEVFISTDMKPVWCAYCLGGKGKSPPLPTEELAELHAIIQAIEWERAQNTGTTD